MRDRPKSDVVVLCTDRVNSLNPVAIIRFSVASLSDGGIPASNTDGAFHP